MALNQSVLLDRPDEEVGILRTDSVLNVNEFADSRGPIPCHVRGIPDPYALYLVSDDQEPVVVARDVLFDQEPARRIGMRHGLSEFIERRDVCRHPSAAGASQWLYNYRPSVFSGESACRVLASFGHASAHGCRNLIQPEQYLGSRFVRAVFITNNRAHGTCSSFEAKYLLVGVSCCEQRLAGSK